MLQNKIQIQAPTDEKTANYFVQGMISKTQELMGGLTEGDIERQQRADEFMRAKEDERTKVKRTSF